MQTHSPFPNMNPNPAREKTTIINSLCLPRFYACCPLQLFCFSFAVSFVQCFFLLVGRIEIFENAKNGPWNFLTVYPNYFGIKTNLDLNWTVKVYICVLALWLKYLYWICCHCVLQFFNMLIWIGIWLIK